MTDIETWEKADTQGMLRRIKVPGGWIYAGCSDDMQDREWVVANIVFVPSIERGIDLSEFVIRGEDVENMKFVSDSGDVKNLVPGNIKGLKDWKLEVKMKMEP